MPSKDEQLWTVLDEWGIPFRETMESLISKYGHRSSEWTENLEYCEITTDNPFHEHLAHPFMFQFQPGVTPLYVRSDDFWSHIRKSNDAQDNYDLAVRALEGFFGEGQDASVSNTKAVKWQFDLAQVQAYIFSPAKVDKSNSRHMAIPESATECTISITPSWRSEPTQDEMRFLRSAEKIRGFDGEAQARPGFPSLFTRSWPNEIEEFTPGLRISQGDDVLIHKHEKGLVRFIPVPWVKKVEVVNLLPARGGGGAQIDLLVVPHNQKESIRYTLVSNYGKPNAFNKFGRELSERLKVPVEIFESLDC